MSYLKQIDLDESGLAVPSPELEQELRVAVFDLQEGNSFRINGVNGPYGLVLGMDGGRAVFDWTAADDEQGRFTLALGDLAQEVKDYRSLCDSYVEAVKTLPPARIAEIDEARRAIHGEAARKLQSRLAPHADVDEATARRLFTLICAMAPA